MHILMIDDVPAMAESYGRGLVARGWKVSYRESAEKALDEFGRQDFPYDLVVLDLSMPIADVQKRFSAATALVLEALSPDERAHYCGKCLYLEFRGTFERTDPVIILTNYAQDVLTSDIIDPLLLVLDKGDTTPGGLFESCFQLKREWERRRTVTGGSAAPAN